jgi:hypothetical protein
MHRRDRVRTTADEWDFLEDRGRYRRLICHSRSHLRWIKNNWNRRVRRAAVRELSRRVENYEKGRESKWGI